MKVDFRVIGAHYLAVYLDGVKVEFCRDADSDRGIVHYYAFEHADDPLKRRLIRDETGTSVKLFEGRGKVVVYIQRDPKHGSAPVREAIKNLGSASAYLLRLADEPLPVEPLAASPTVCAT